MGARKVFEEGAIELKLLLYMSSGCISVLVLQCRFLRGTIKPPMSYNWDCLPQASSRIKNYSFTSYWTILTYFYIIIQLLSTKLIMVIISMATSPATVNSKQASLLDDEETLSVFSPSFFVSFLKLYHPVQCTTQ